METKKSSEFNPQNQEAPFCPYANGLDPNIKYTQKFHYAPESLYPHHYETKNK